MSQPVCRLEDLNSGGGAVLNGINSILVNGRPVAAKTFSNVKGHDTHPTNPIVEGDHTVLVGTFPIAFITCKCACGHIMIEGSPNVIVRGIP